MPDDDKGPAAGSVMRVVSATAFDTAALAELFTAGFSGYRFPMQLSEQGFSDHVALYDLDLGLSRVVVDDDPAAFAHVGRRGHSAWIGGMGTVPSHRRQGLGERALTAAIKAAFAHGCSEIGLEVLEGNEPAIQLYEKLGFERVRDLAIWSLPAIQRNPDAAASAIEFALAQEWIAAHRSSPEPWQRADASLLALQRRGMTLRALAIRQDDELAAAAIIRELPETTSLLQIAAVDQDAASNILLAAAEGGPTLRFANVPPGDPASLAIKRLGAECVVVQHEMLLRAS